MFKEYVSKLRLLSRDMRLLLATSTLIGFTVFGGIYTVLLNLYLLRLGYEARFIGLINGVGLLSSGLFSVPVGVVSERVGMRRMLILSMILGTIGFVALPCAEFAPAGLRSAWLLATYFVGNLGIRAWAVNACPFLTAATSEQERSHAFSSSFGLASVGAFIGSLVASFVPGAFAALLESSLAEPAPYRYTLLFAGALLSAMVFSVSQASPYESMTPPPLTSVALEYTALALIVALLWSTNNPLPSPEEKLLWTTFPRNTLSLPRR